MLFAFVAFETVPFIVDAVSVPTVNVFVEALYLKSSSANSGRLAPVYDVVKLG